MDDVLSFLAMGGYAAYVWPAFGVTALTMGALVWSSIRGLRADRRTLERLEGARTGRRGSPGAGETRR